MRMHVLTHNQTHKYHLLKKKKKRSLIPIENSYTGVHGSPAMTRVPILPSLQNRSNRGNLPGEDATACVQTFMWQALSFLPCQANTCWLLAVYHRLCWANYKDSLTYSSPQPTKTGTAFSLSVIFWNHGLILAPSPFPIAHVMWF